MFPILRWKHPVMASGRKIAFKFAD